MWNQADSFVPVTWSASSALTVSWYTGLLVETEPGCGLRVAIPWVPDQVPSKGCKADIQDSGQRKKGPRLEPINCFLSPSFTPSPTPTRN